MEGTVFRGDDPTAVKSKVGYLLSGPVNASSTHTRLMESQNSSKSLLLTIDTHTTPTTQEVAITKAMTFSFDAFYNKSVRAKKKQPTPESYFKTCQPDGAVRHEQTTTAARRIPCQPVRKYASTTKKMMYAFITILYCCCCSCCCNV